jgi:hypothetical protein
MLIMHNVFALYAEILFACDTQWGYFNIDKAMNKELSFIEGQSDIAYQFIFDSEFKNISANTNVFEEHNNLNSEIRSFTGFVAVFSIHERTARINSSHKNFLTNIYFPISYNQELYRNLHCFRI